MTTDRRAFTSLETLRPMVRSASEMQRVSAAVAAVFVPGVAHARAEELERDVATGYGRSLGLTAAATAEVIEEWIAWYRTRPDPVDWPRIRLNLLNRSLREHWKPPASHAEA